MRHARRLLLALIAFAPITAQAQPAIPFHTNYTYWDHHWLQWLPTHPRFEAIEASVASVPDGRRYIRVWLTEREMPKRQVHYFDDPNVAKGMRRDSHFVPMEYTILGQDRAPRGLDLNFRDETGQRIDWRVTFPADAPLSSQFAG